MKLNSYGELRISFKGLCRIRIILDEWTLRVEFFFPQWLSLV